MRAAVSASRGAFRSWPSLTHTRNEVRGLVTLATSSRPVTVPRTEKKWPATHLRRLTAAVSTQPEETSVHGLDQIPSDLLLARKLPPNCPGCGAPSQTVSPEDAGFYTLSKSRIKSFLTDTRNDEDKIFEAAIAAADTSTLQALDLSQKAQQQPAKEAPICDRCHQLIHHHTGTSIYHPSIQSIQDILSESPYKHNHIYHVLDAADFPMSVIPKLQHALSLPRLRTQNRRSKTQVYSRGRVAEVSFIITRSDLLAPKKEQVDALMPYMREVLREALNVAGKNFRLGNVRLVSARRGWWTKEVKEDIWNRGGAGWMVGKVNVGKSNLFEVVFPKGRGQEVKIDRLRNAANKERAAQDVPVLTPTERLRAMVRGEDVKHVKSKRETVPTAQAEDEDDYEVLDEDEQGLLLPRAQAETAYPVMPIISSLPGTTASPIRVPFGKGKGELIDLPGVARSGLEDYVLPEHKQDIIMKSRVTPDQHTIRPGQSLLLGGLVRITPTTPDLVFLAYPFVPIKPHVTSTLKAVALETGERDPALLSFIATEDARAKWAKAGTFKLQWDTTKKRAGPLTDPTAAKLKAEQLPFVVYSADMLIESVGWVELVAQVRRTSHGDEYDDTRLPEVEVFSPSGKFVAVRPPMGAWMLGGKTAAKSLRKSRPRMSIGSLKKSRAGRAVE